MLYRGACGSCGAMASLAVPGRRPNSRRQVRGFLRLEIEKAKPRGWPFGASSFLEGEYKLAKNPTSEHPKSKTPKFRGLRGFYFLLSGR